MMLFLVNGLLFAVLIGSVDSFQCPAKCQCENNGTSVRCQGWLIKVPNLPNNVEHLDLSQNFLGPLINKTFFPYGQLTHLDLSHNGLVNMTERGLRGLTRLEVLDLSHNNLRHLPSNMFCDNSNLRELDLSHNMFRILPDPIFRSLDNLRFFSISNNKLTKLKLGPRWQVPTKLEKLDFSHNKFDNLTYDAFEFTSYWDVTVKRSLNLRNCGIKFIANGTFAQFKGLHELDLSDNPGLSGELINYLLLELEESRIKRLDLSGLQMTNIRPLFQNVDQLSLEYLNLADNFLRSIPEGAVGNVRSIKHLNLSNNNLATEITGLKDLGNLKTLDLSSNQLLRFPLEITTRMSRLTFLDLSHNQIQSPSHLELAPLSYLQVLNVSHNKLDELVLPGNTTDLAIMKYDHNQIMKLFSIYNIPKLEHFDISGNKLISLGSFLFSQTYNFQLANFSDNQITNIDHRSFLPSSPTVIDLSHNALKEVKFASWTDAHKILLHHNEIMEISYQAFYGMKGLISLDLSFNKLTSIHELTFKHLGHLSELRLGHNSLNVKPEVFVDLFKPMKSLKTLDLSHNELSDINVTTFLTCSGMKKLSLAYNKFSYIPVTLFDHLGNLTFMDASGNPYNCDCSILPFRNWIRHNRHIKMGWYNKTKYVCVSPASRKGYTLQDFTEGKFECNQSLLFMMIFGSIGSFIILVGIIGSLIYYYYRKWRKKHPQVKAKKRKLFKIDRIRKPAKSDKAKNDKNDTEYPNKMQNGGSSVPYQINEKDVRLSMDQSRRLPQYRASKYNLPQVLPSEAAINWQRVRSRNDPRRFHTVNPRVQNQYESWDRWNQSPSHYIYPTLPNPHTVSQYDVTRNRPERGVTFDMNRNRHHHRRSVDDTYVDNYRHRYIHPRDLHRTRNMEGYGERKYSMPDVYMYDKQSDWV